MIKFVLVTPFIFNTKFIVCIAGDKIGFDKIQEHV